MYLSTYAYTWYTRIIIKVKCYYSLDQQFLLIILSVTIYVTSTKCDEVHQNVMRIR